jgi:hypothetical protein
VPFAPGGTAKKICHDQGPLSAAGIVLLLANLVGRNRRQQRQPIRRPRREASPVYRPATRRSRTRSTRLKKPPGQQRLSPRTRSPTSRAPRVGARCSRR